MKINDILPQFLAERVYMMTKTADVLEAIRRLCSIGMTELVLYITISIAGYGAQTTNFNPIPISDKVDSCRVVDEGTISYLVFELRRGEMKDSVCIAIEREEASGEKDSSLFLRPCTALEIRHVEAETGGGEEEAVKGKIVFV